MSTKVNGIEKTEKQKKNMKLTNYLIYSSFAIRISSIFFVGTQFVPDEQWQSTEVAHNIVSGQGHLTWEWMVGLRSYFYPVCFAFLYKIIYALGMDNSFSLIYIPRLFQAILTATGESLFFLYCKKKYGIESTKWIAFTFFSSWFIYFCASRTLTNTMEMSLNMIALYLLENKKIAEFGAVVVLNFFIRPTAVVIWIPLAKKIIGLATENLRRFFRCIALCVLVFTLNTTIDTLLYGQFVLPWLNFFVFNVLEGKSAEFGVHSFFWYFYNGLPSIIGINMILLLVVIYFQYTKYKEEIQTIGLFLALFSFISHKEIRFLLPIIPICFAIIGDYSSYMYNSHHKTKVRYLNFNLKWAFKAIMAISVISNLIALIIFSQVHQSGIKPSVNFINGEIKSKHMNGPNIWIMMPCYSLPVHTYFYDKNAKLEYFTCAPKSYPLKHSQPNLMEEDFSNFDIEKFFLQKIEDGNYPDFIMSYDQTVKKIQRILKSLSLNYAKCHSSFHTYFPFDNIGKSVEILCAVK